MLTILPAPRPLLFASAFMIMAAAAGCGLKGDLVLPDSSEQASTQTDPEERSDESNSDSDSDADNEPETQP